MLGIPVLIIGITLYHLAIWNSPQPTPTGIQPHRTISLIRAPHQPAAANDGLPERAVSGV